jgi:hypothetical protein
LGKALQQNANLKHLDLRLNHLQDQGGYSLMVLLLGNKSISSLDISGNGLDSKSVTALCALLKLNSSTLTHLDLSCNKLGNYSEKSSSNTNLRDVKATDVTGKQIFEAIAQNKVLFANQSIFQVSTCERLVFHQSFWSQFKALHKKMDHFNGCFICSWHLINKNGNLFFIEKYWPSRFPIWSCNDIQLDILYKIDSRLVKPNHLQA